MLQQTKGKQNCIIDDVRYQNEVDALIDDGWVLIQLYVPYEVQKLELNNCIPTTIKIISMPQHIYRGQNKFVFPKGYPQLVFDTQD